MGKGKRDPVERIRENKKGSRALVIGLVAGGVVVALALALVLALVVIPKWREKDTEQTPASEIETNVLQAQPESERQSESSVERETLTPIQNAESEMAQTEDSRVEGVLDQMTVDQKVDQLFILPPIVMVNAALADQGESVPMVKSIGETTEQAYEKMMPGGLLISKSNIDDDDGTILPFIDEAGKLQAGEERISPFIMVTDDVAESLRQSGTDAYVAGTLYHNATALPGNGGLRIKEIENAPADVTQENEWLYAMLQGDCDLFCVPSEEFDYVARRAGLVAAIQRNGIEAETLLNEKVAAVLTWKLGTEAGTGQRLQELQTEQGWQENQTGQRSQELQTEQRWQENQTGQRSQELQTEQRWQENQTGQRSQELQTEQRWQENQTEQRFGGMQTEQHTNREYDGFNSGENGVDGTSYEGGTEHNGVALGDSENG